MFSSLAGPFFVDMSLRRGSVFALFPTRSCSISVHNFHVDNANVQRKCGAEPLVIARIGHVHHSGEHLTPQNTAEVELTGEKNKRFQRWKKQKR